MGDLSDMRPIIEMHLTMEFVRIFLKETKLTHPTNIVHMHERLKPDRQTDRQTKIRRQTDHVENTLWARVGQGRILRVGSEGPCSNSQGE